MKSSIMNMLVLTVTALMSVEMTLHCHALVHIHGTGPYYFATIYK